MNRAWIPAAALAGVSVAGLIALGPLTDSLNTKVPFPTAVTTEAGPQPRAFVAVSYSKGPSGTTSTKSAALKRGGASTTPPPTSDTGQVGYRHYVATPPTSQTAPSTPSSTPTAPAKPKKTTKRAKSIGAVGETNGDSGFAGGSGASSGLGETNSKPGSATP